MVRICACLFWSFGTSCAGRCEFGVGLELCDQGPFPSVFFQWVRAKGTAKWSFGEASRPKTGKWTATIRPISAFPNFSNGLTFLTRFPLAAFKNAPNPKFVQNLSRRLFLGVPIRETGICQNLSESYRFSSFDKFLTNSSRPDWNPQKQSPGEILNKFGVRGVFESCKRKKVLQGRALYGPIPVKTETFRNFERHWSIPFAGEICLDEWKDHISPGVQDSGSLISVP